MTRNSDRSNRPPRAVFLTGAGLSAESGIPTFRGDGGLYKGMRAEEVLSAEMMRRSPVFIHRFMDDRRVALRDAEPNEAHRVLSRLASDFGGRVSILTQNIDDMFERAGLTTAVHLHGFLTRMRSVGNSKVTEDIGHRRYWDGDPSVAPERGFQFRCPKSNSRFRPDVVLFDELAPEYARLYREMRNLGREDVLVVIGTQGSVLPVSRFAAKAPCLTILNNIHASEDIDEADFEVILRERATASVGRIEEMVRSRLGAPPEPRESARPAGSAAR